VLPSGAMGGGVVSCGGFSGGGGSFGGSADGAASVGGASAGGGFAASGAGALPPSGACSGGCPVGSVGSVCEHMVAIFLVFLMALRIFSGSAHPIIVNFC